MKAKLQEYALLAEIISAIAIIISLIYVGIQVNDSTRAVRSATANETSAALSSWYSELGNNRDASELFWKGMTNPESLTPEESFQFIVNIQGVFWLWQNAYYLAEEGTLDQELRDSIMNLILGLREIPGFKFFWEQRRNLFKLDFQRTVDEMLDHGVTNREIEYIYRPPVSSEND
jgi:hypothetical protein